MNMTMLHQTYIAYLVYHCCNTQTWGRYIMWIFNNRFFELYNKNECTSM